MAPLKKILNVAQIRATDKYTMDNAPIASIDLMEQAALAFVKAFEKHSNASKKIIIVCGVGNNGGDGLAVSRLLRQKGMDVHVMLVKFKETLSADCKINKNRLKEVEELTVTDTVPDFAAYDIIIDALFGSGLNNPVKGFPAAVIAAINKAEKTVFSIDVPSGLPCDAISTSKSIVNNSHVISFQRPKLAFFFPEHRAYIRDWEVVDIGLDEAFIQAQKSNYFLLDESVAKIVKIRAKQSHKGTYGHALLLAGSHGKMGAAVLSTKACLRSGVGLLTTCVPKCGYNILQIAAPEAMCLTDENAHFLTELPTLSNYDVVGAGPGIGKDKLTVKMLQSLLEKSTQPLVLDADAINIISANQKLLALLPKRSVLTPHVKEFDRLVGPSKNTLERHEKQGSFSKKHQCIIVLKDAYTCISSTTGEFYINTSGNQGMATGGSGDALTGVITGLIAQHYDLLNAAIVGVYFHGKAGDKGAEKKGYNALLASDIVENLRIQPYGYTH
ncbi:bifunctional ADP-dependent NAD(P)H-hydrate dehydratase/NAD(P)H-hydrate epimerase [Putridiphycobacter roseus]|uniref:Bifunctional NAD(P)H-hydrate repair enzyme n=1 Tax=Putridiphycobacter roseus TaxID=2219161 RepID=A0A2W1MY86_9FLAO|nr:NAD(P)H-hydrate dehydratase [Putridiphycobacter roseus]PZE17129.1 bifunctional ADP-dependent NAD(P)H-hydrate dehydratase/NAD(P)H-hydrate epimerase [Putridiphycobacter roseus]